MRFLPVLLFLLLVSSLPAQETVPSSTSSSALPSLKSEELGCAACQDPQQSQQNPKPQQPPAPDTSNSAPAPAPDLSQQPTPEVGPNPSLPNPQPQRILGVMPNFRAVSAGTLPPPPTPKQSLWLATQNSFDYSAFLFCGFTSLEAIASNAHPELGKGLPGYGRYYWRGFLDRTDGNYWVIFILPTFLHQDERYYAMGKGGFLKRSIYSASRILITPNYEGHNTFNASEIFGRGVAQAISVSYYPPQSRTAGSIARKYGFAIGRDALTNVFREFWPDIAVHVLHRHP